MGRVETRARLPRHTGAHTPALMLGTAGIGYSLLRFRDPSAVPSVLVVSGTTPGRDPRRAE